MSLLFLPNIRPNFENVDEKKSLWSSGFQNADHGHCRPLYRKFAFSFFYIFFFFFQFYFLKFLATGGLVYGLVTVSSPSLIFGASHTVEEVIKKDVESEDSAETQEIASEIKNGTISPKDQKHYEAGLVITVRSYR